jgi:hypothetical protein
VLLEPPEQIPLGRLVFFGLIWKTQIMPSWELTWPTEDDAFSFPQIGRDHIVNMSVDSVRTDDLVVLFVHGRFMSGISLGSQLSVSSNFHTREV